jgi:hypothetical protein
VHPTGYAVIPNFQLKEFVHLPTDA